MIRSSKVRLIMLAVVAFSVYAFAIGAPDEEAQSLVTIREAPEHVVIYTLHRGTYDGTGPTIGRLFALLGSNGLAPSSRAPPSSAIRNAITTMALNRIALPLPTRCRGSVVSVSIMIV